MHTQRKEILKRQMMAARIIQQAWRSAQARAKKVEEAKETAISSAACCQTIRWPLRPQKIWKYQAIGAGGFGKVWLEYTAHLFDDMLIYTCGTCFIHLILIHTNREQF